MLLLINNESDNCLCKPSSFTTLSLKFSNLLTAEPKKTWFENSEKSMFKLTSFFLCVNEETTSSEPVIISE